MLLYLDKGANSKSEIPCQVSSDHQLHLDFINKDAHSNYASFPVGNRGAEVTDLRPPEATPKRHLE